MIPQFPVFCRFGSTTLPPPLLFTTGFIPTALLQFPVEFTHTRFTRRFTFYRVHVRFPHAVIPHHHYLHTLPPRDITPRSLFCCRICFTVTTDSLCGSTRSSRFRTYAFCRALRFPAFAHARFALPLVHHTRTVCARRSFGSVGFTHAVLPRYRGSCPHHLTFALLRYALLTVYYAALPRTHYYTPTPHLPRTHHYLYHLRSFTFTYLCALPAAVGSRFYRVWLPRFPLRLLRLPHTTPHTTVVAVGSITATALRRITTPRGYHVHIHTHVGSRFGYFYYRTYYGSIPPHTTHFAVILPLVYYHWVPFVPTLPHLVYHTTSYTRSFWFTHTTPHHHYRFGWFSLPHHHTFGSRVPLFYHTHTHYWFFTTPPHTRL